MMRQRFVFVLSSILLLAGCGLTRPAVEIRSYMLMPQWPHAPSAAQALHIRVSPFDVAPQFESKSLVYRFSDVRYEADFYNEFLVPPRIMLMERSVEWLRHAGYDAVENGGRDAYVLHAQVPLMYGDFRDAAQPRAALTIRFRLDAPGAAEPVLQREYAVTVPIADRSAETVARGLSEALAQALQQLHADLQALCASRACEAPTR